MLVVGLLASLDVLLGLVRFAVRIDSPAVVGAAVSVVVADRVLRRPAVEHELAASEVLAQVHVQRQVLPRPSKRNTQMRQGTSQ